MDISLDKLYYFSNKFFSFGFFKIFRLSFHAIFANFIFYIFNINNEKGFIHYTFKPRIVLTISLFDLSIYLSIYLSVCMHVCKS